MNAVLVLDFEEDAAERAANEVGDSAIRRFISGTEDALESEAL